MPITVKYPIRHMSQAEFGDLAYKVMRTVFSIRDELGRFFEAHALRLLEHTSLNAILWANVGRRIVAFKTLKRGQKNEGQKNGYHGGRSKEAT